MTLTLSTGQYAQRGVLQYWQAGRFTDMPVCPHTQHVHCVTVFFFGASCIGPRKGVTMSLPSSPSSLNEEESKTEPVCPSCSASPSRDDPEAASRRSHFGRPAHALGSACEPSACFRDGSASGETHILVSLKTVTPAASRDQSRKG